MSCEYVVQRAAASLPQSTTDTLFTVSVGNVLFLGVVGTVTASIQAQPTLTTVSVDSAQILASPDINGFAVGALIGPALHDSDLLSVTGADVVGVLAAGSSVQFSCSASSTGQVRWTLWYRPLDPGAVVMAV